MALTQISEPLTIFLLGVTGDLSKKKILKAIYRLFEKKLLASPFTLIGNARTPLSREEFVTFVRSIVRPTDDSVWQAFAQCLHYVSGSTTELATFSALQALHHEVSRNDGCGNHMWYMATLPSLYIPIIQNLKKTHMQTSHCGWTKILIEKPFGTDLATATALNAELSSVFTEDQIYRIDHFLGKETVQNLLTFRFANGIFEELWSNEYIDHVQVTLAETLGIEGREQFYDATGEVRDMVQSHLLQMVAVSLMDEPRSLSAEHIRASRAKLLSALTCMPGSDDAHHVRFGQYASGVIDGASVPGYRDNERIPADSRTETAVALRLMVNTPRWSGVPIYMRAGKRMARTVLELSVQFKDKPNKMFSRSTHGHAPNILTFRFQPNEGIVLRLAVKKPGHGVKLDMVPMQFCYRNNYQMDFIEAYERLIYDASKGDATLFPDAAGIESAWKIIDELLQQKKDVVPELYEAGSFGPASFDRLIAEDGRTWIEPSIDVCSL